MHRLLLLLLAISLPTYFTFLSLRHFHPRQEDEPRYATSYFRSASALFPPAAIISLTDDNSTFFLARPAAFGASLASSGLSAQLWVGSGFGGESLPRSSSSAAEEEGELGCADVSGWEKSHQESKMDEHLPHLLSQSSKAQILPHDRQHNYADIQSIQEGAEISGKVALLSRGRCSFSEKVKWAQRRGAVAVIVGDNIVGGSLVTMFAHGEASNITIPALFTSRTTAHLLSSLIPQERLVVPPTSRPLKQENLVDWTETAWTWLSTKGSKTTPDRWRPPSSGQLEKKKVRHEPAPSSRQVRDDFVIGTHDWRDPDLVLRDPKIISMATTSSSSVSRSTKAPEQFSGGSITPGSGQYGNSRVPTTHDPHPLTTLPDELRVSQHEGLWLTLTPTHVSASPFIETFLVLVVSPLVTLAIVYAIVLVRTRLQQRRWRAPKSVVEGLPIRTYHATSVASDSSGVFSSFLAGRQSSGLRLPLSPDLAPHMPGSEPDLERQETTKKYRGCQLECVVCLERYVDGESKVMMLPCGHEFHVECITPWLLNRRRVCPICKGDVVRALEPTNPDMDNIAN